METIIHPFSPIYDSDSRVLILGTMPSPKSRENRFYYGHPRNRFWPVMAALFGREPFQSNAEKTAFLLEHHIALWDVFAACDIHGADDASIRNAVPNDLDIIFNQAPIAAVFTNGKKASEAYRRNFGKNKAAPHIELPSTSPANCAVKYDALLAAYRSILDYL